MLNNIFKINELPKDSIFFNIKENLNNEEFKDNDMDNDIIEVSINKGDNF